MACYLRKITYALSVCILLLCAFVICCSAAGADVFEKCVVVSDGEALVMSSPDSHGEVLSEIENGETVIRISRGASKFGGFVWDRILFEGGVGYVPSDSLEYTKDSQTIKLIKSKITVGLNETVDIFSLISDRDEDGEYRFFPLDESAVSVDENGLIKANKKGTAFIGIVKDGKIAKIAVEVLDELTGFSLDNEYIEIKAGDTFRLNVTCKKGFSYEKTFTSSDSSVATVDSDGLITAKKNGTAEIKVTSYNGKSTVCTVKVCYYPSEIKITNSNNVIQKGSNNHQVKYKITNGAANQKVTFSVSDSTVASVSESGYVRGLSVGTTILTVKTESGVTATQIIVVKNDSFEMNRNSTQLSLDMKNVTKIKYGVSHQGRNLEAFVITNASKTNYKKTLFMDFAVHGFEDDFFRDGKLLVNEANALINYFAKNSTLLGDYRLVIVPCANPDGTVAGKNNLRAQSDAFGRCTADHIDINRDFIDFSAAETRALRDIIKSTSPTVYLNMHGWYDETIGDEKLGKLIQKELGLKDFDNHYGADSGYAIGWVHKNLKIPVTLVEYASPNDISTPKDIKMIRAIIKNF